jgi:hypothetical protein
LLEVEGWEIRGHTLRRIHSSRSKPADREGEL